MTGRRRDNCVQPRQENYAALPAIRLLQMSLVRGVGGDRRSRPGVTEGMVSLIWSWAASPPDVLRKRWRCLDDQS